MGVTDILDIIKKLFNIPGVSVKTNKNYTSKYVVSRQSMIFYSFPVFFERNIPKKDETNTKNNVFMAYESA